MLEEFDANTTRSWLLNDVGECTFTIGKRNPKLKKYAIEFGNYILVTNRYTDPWVGVIDVPRVWTRRGPQVTAYSAEHLFSKRIDQDRDPTTNLLVAPVTLEGVAGEIYRQLINRANRREDTLLRPYSIFMDGVPRQETIKSNYLTHVKNLSTRTGQDFDVTHVLSANNELSLSANWYVSKGVGRTIALEEGVNIELGEEIMVEQGTLHNSVVGVGAGSVDSSRLAAIAKVARSQLVYGLREAVVTYSTVTEFPTLQDNVNVYANKNAYPRLTARIICTEQGLFTDLNVGDTIPLIFHSAGFATTEDLGLSTTTRIIGLQAHDDKGTMDVLVDEFIEE